MSGTGTAFDSEAGYRAAIALTLAGARLELRIFDSDLTAMGLEERAQVALLDRFLAAGCNRRLNVVVHDLAPLQSRLPRLLALLRDYAPQVEVRVTPEHLREIAEAWVLADQESGTIRFHTDHARGKHVAAIAAEIAPWWQRADDLWGESTPAIPWITTGL